ncbi:TPA: hypothetical protein KOU56_003644 [Clostridioides difficile]|nr:hypothetical protein [Clostridioides difficile]
MSNRGNHLAENDIIKSIKEYIDDSIYNHAILIDGDWGSGKTYFVKNNLIKEIESYSNKKVIYISLYGIKATQDISNEISISIFDKTKGKKAKFIKKTKTILSSGVKIGADILKNKGIDILNLKDIFEELLNLSKYILVFDDLERCNCNVNEVLGYINNFVEHDGIKVIIVANEKEIKSNESYKEYVKIKEKLIGITINYSPNLESTTKQFIETHIKDSKLKEMLLSKVQDFNKLAIEKEHINLRTYQFFISKVITLNKMLNIEQEIYNSVMKTILDYAFKVCIYYKKGVYNTKWEKDLSYGFICMGDKMNMNDYIMGFKFIDEYITSNILNKSDIESTIKDYYNDIVKNAQDTNDPFNKYTAWWEFDDLTIKNGLDKILKNLKENKYSISLYPKIVGYILNLTRCGFDSSYEKIFFNVMKDNALKVTKIIYLDKSFAYIDSEDLLDKYKNILNDIQNNLSQNKHKDLNEKLKLCFSDEDNWGKNFLNYISHKKKFDYVEEASYVMEQLDVERIIFLIERSNNYNLTCFRKAMTSIYYFDIGIKDFFGNTTETLKKLINNIENINIDNFDNVKKYNIKLILEFLNKKYELLK